MTGLEQNIELVMQNDIWRLLMFVMPKARLKTIS